MAKPKSSASLAFRLNARLFFRQLLTFVLLDLLLCLLFFGAGIYLTDRLCLELSRALNQSVPREEAETVPSLSLEGLSAEYQRELPEGKELLPWLFGFWQRWSGESLERYYVFQEGAFSIYEKLCTMEYFAAVPQAEGSWLVIRMPVGRTLGVFWLCFLGVIVWEGFSLFFFLFRNIRYVSATLRPLRELTATTQVLSGGGKRAAGTLKNITGTLDSITASHLDARIPLNRVSNEFKPLAEAINEMLNRINEAYRSQMRFVSDASHELRTPIAVIQGYANLLTRWGTEDPATLQESIQAIKGEADAMKEMVEQLLFLARGDNDSMHLVWEKLDLTKLAGEVARELPMLDDSHPFFPELSGPAFVEGDAGLLKQLLRILIDNALKYTPKGKEIYLRVCREEPASPGDGRSRVLLRVQDEGIGIAPEALPHIFDRFYRADESRARNTGGTGLGLAIAQWIVERHGGFVEVVSREGVGTRFSVYLPEAEERT